MMTDFSKISIYIRRHWWNKFYQILQVVSLQKCIRELIEKAGFVLTKPSLFGSKSSTCEGKNVPNKGNIMEISFFEFLAKNSYKC